MVANFFGELLYCEKMKVNGISQSFGTTRFSLTMTLTVKLDVLLMGTLQTSAGPLVF